jgi:starvation-inducible DNA-binding protein
MEKQELIDKMKVVLASAFSLYLKAHNYHWNVTGQNFKQYHDFFGQFYEDVHDSVDLYAEHIRALKAVAPGSLKRFAELTIISDEIAVPSPKFMFVRLSQDNERFLAELREARNIADSLNEFGVVNFLEDRIDFHEKMQWMIDAYTE